MTHSTSVASSSFLSHPPTQAKANHLIQREGPLLISLPHNGDFIPHDLLAQMHPYAKESEDTDWFMYELYAPLAHALNASLLCSSYSRYVVDLNRPSTDETLYPGQNTTGLFPKHTFSGRPLYLNPTPISSQESQHRIDQYWTPYHQSLQSEIQRLSALHPHIVVWEGHSIKSHVPFLFEGQLPDFNLGTNQGQSCSTELQKRLVDWIQSDLTSSLYSGVMNGRFRGGYITRHYGGPSFSTPDRTVSTIQLELSQRTYLKEDEFPHVWDPDFAHPVQTVIKNGLNLVLQTLSHP